LKIRSLTILKKEKCVLRMRIAKTQENDIKVLYTDENNNKEPK